MYKKQIKAIEIKNYQGIRAAKIEPKKINIFSGRNGSNKSSFLESIAKGLSNTAIRPDTITYNEKKMELTFELPETNDIIKRTETTKSSSLKINGGKTPRPQNYINDILGSGTGINPVDFLRLSGKEQVNLLLSKADFSISKDKLISEFPGNESLFHLNAYSAQTILDKVSEVYKVNYKKRKEANSALKEIKVIKSKYESEIPVGFNEKFVEDFDMQVLYNNLYEARLKKDKIIASKRELEILNKNLATSDEQLKDKLDSLHSKMMVEYRKELGDINQVKKDKILEIADIDRQIRELQNRRHQLSEYIDNQHDAAVAKLIRDSKSKYEEASEKVKLIHNSQTSEEQLKREKVNKFLKENDGFNPDFDAMQRVIDEMKESKSKLKIISEIKSLSEREKWHSDEAKKYQDSINKALAFPRKMFEQLDLPIKDLGIDENMNLIVGDLRLDSLNTSQKIKIAIDVARYTANKLKVICVDNFEQLDKSNQLEFLNQIQDDDYEYYLAVVSDTDLTITASDKAEDFNELLGV